MNNLLLSANVVLPLFLLMVTGYALRHWGILDEKTLKQMNKATFKAFLPCLIYYNVYTSEISEIFDKKLVIFSVISILILFAVLMLTIPFAEKDNRKKGVMIQGIFRSNFVIFGIPLSAALYGDSIVGSAAVLIAVVVPVFNFLAVISLEVFRKGKPDIVKILKGIATNPLIISSILGLITLFTGFKLPGIIEKSVSDLAKIATPLALVILGGSINFSKIKGNGRQLAVCVASRLVIVPAVFLSISALLGFRNAEMAILISVFASPTAVSSFTMAQQMDGDDELAGQIVVFGTSLCIITVFLWIFLFKQLGIM
ncbi:MAG: AEC family transporter [Clostridia bacterium]|nr:AEC family transporter [Clostridia bacterium]